MGTDTFVAGEMPSAGTNADWRTGMARVGLVAKGVLNLTLGALALQLAFGNGGTEASQSGALQAIEQAPAGPLLLGLLAVGLLAHGVWQFLLVFTGDPVEGSGAHKRVKFAWKAVVYLGLGGLAVTQLVESVRGGSSGGGGGGGGTDQAARTLLGMPGGVWIATAVGLVIVLVGASMLWRHAWNGEFMERINRTGHGEVRRNVERAGRAGYTSLAIVYLVTGGFFVVAAIQHDPSQSRGMSGALTTLADQPWGPWLLTGVALGLVLYGLFCLAEARYRRAG